MPNLAWEEDDDGDWIQLEAIDGMAEGGEGKEKEILLSVADPRCCCAENTELQPRAVDSPRASLAREMSRVCPHVLFLLYRSMQDC